MNRRRLTQPSIEEIKRIYDNCNSLKSAAFILDIDVRNLRQIRNIENWSKKKHAPTSKEMPPRKFGHSIYDSVETFNPVLR